MAESINSPGEKFETILAHIVRNVEAWP